MGWDATIAVLGVVDAVAEGEVEGIFVGLEVVVLPGFALVATVDEVGVFIVGNAFGNAATLRVGEKEGEGVVAVLGFIIIGGGRITT